ncbi:HyaD/HybD family hydrogenase maturation endopeptidase [Azorhizobium doebereinerae]|uniref:HyaD/HybD family hydrogenase maturation endopeptidase n=1 Tax=Azorhizobium doebereinerae TaxID=281091 RepID=UPI000404B51A|nr:HyaD/HybD family hydrogenase maturation endopeptidase [Azorhizobium doebereinerae]
MSDERILVLGIGNILWADEGFGVRVVEALDRAYDIPDQVRLLDGGTQGLYLLPALEEADVVIILDAVDYGLPPGTLHCLADADVPAVLSARKLSLHQTGFQEVLALLQLRGCLPRALRLVGVQPHTLDDYGGGLTEGVAAQVAPAMAEVVRLLSEEFGIALQPAAPRAAGLMAPAIGRAAYEAGRPSADAACRVGDERVLRRGWDG